MDERREGRQFGQFIREGVGRVVSGLENFPKRFVSFIIHHPLESAITATLAVNLALVTYLGIDGLKEPVWPPITQGMMTGAVVALVVLPAAFVAASSEHQQRAQS